MFTGIIEEIGTVKEVRHGHRSAVVTISAEKVLPDTSIGDSIAVNGVCLTVIAMDDDSFSADATPETISRSSLGQMHRGSRVNLERAMAADGRFGGHIVSGHVDACGRVAALEKDGIALLMRVSVPEQVLRYIAEKGSVTLDGTSLTVASVWADSFTVSLIPHTMAATTLHLLRVGSPVNVEVDMLARYVERLLHSGNGADSGAKGGLSMEFLRQNGF